MKSPIVSVVMSVYNGGSYLADAIDSILQQSFTDFEFIIVNDGSSDDSTNIINSFAKKDQRIKVLEQENQGLVASLNRGIRESAGQYIARQDADDRSALERLAKQVAFLQQHPHVVIIGSGIQVMDNEGKILHQHKVLLKDPELRQELLIRSPFAHGSVVFKRQAAMDAGLYDAETWPAEDYDLWLRLSKYGELANLDECLYIYREHTAGISSQNAKIQKQKVAIIQHRAWQEHDRLASKQKVNLRTYKNLEMGQERIERIIDNSVSISKLAWTKGQKKLALKNISMLATERIAFKKAAGKIKRRIKS
jgi:glycosyltransferase involved in cell wall biosynthesis